MSKNAQSPLNFLVAELKPSCLLHNYKYKNSTFSKFSEVTGSQILKSIQMTYGTFKHCIDMVQWIRAKVWETIRKIRELGDSNDHPGFRTTLGNSPNNAIASS